MEPLGPTKRKLKGVVWRYQSQPVDRAIYLINPLLRGWVNKFARKLRRVLQLHSRLGRKEGSVAYASGPETKGGWMRWNRTHPCEASRLLGDFDLLGWATRHPRAAGEARFCDRHHDARTCLPSCGAKSLNQPAKS